jgi:hypothetical protein
MIIVIVVVIIIVVVMMVVVVVVVGGGGGANISNNDKGDNKHLFLFFKKIYKRLGEQNLCIFLFRKIKIFSYTFRKLLFIIL